MQGGRPDLKAIYEHRGPAFIPRQYSHARSAGLQEADYEDDESADLDDLEQDLEEEIEKASSSGEVNGKPHDEQSGTGGQSGGGQNKRVAGLRELTDKLGLTLPAGESGRDWDAELRNKKLARIGPFDFGNSGEKRPPLPADAGKPSFSSVAEEASAGSAQATSAEERGAKAGSSGQAKEFPFSEAFREATQLARSAEYPDEVLGSSRQSAGGDVEMEAGAPPGGVAEVQIEAVERSEVTGRGPERMEEEIVIRVLDEEDAGSTGGGSRGWPLT